MTKEDARLSVLEEIEERAQLTGDAAVPLTPTSATELIALWESKKKEEARAVEASRAALERGEITEAELYKGDVMTLTGYVLLKLRAPCGNVFITSTLPVHVELLRDIPDVVDQSIWRQREQIKEEARRNLCSSRGVDPGNFKEELYTRRIEAETAKPLSSLFDLPVHV